MTAEPRRRSFPRRRRVIGLYLSVLVAGAGTGALLLAASRHAWATVQAPGPTRPADALLLCVTAAGTLLVAWVALSLALSLLAGLPGAAGALFSRGAAVLAPAAVRSLAAALLGASLGATLPAGTAMAAVAAAPVTATSTATTSAGRMTGDPATNDPMARDRSEGGVPSAAWPLAPGEGAAGGRTAADKAASTAAGGGTRAGASTSA